MAVAFNRLHCHSCALYIKAKSTFDPGYTKFQKYFSLDKDHFSTLPRFVEIVFRDYLPETNLLY